jgi:hypothetical protein
LQVSFTDNLAQDYVRILPDSVTKIGDWAFGGCYSLNSIIVSRSAYERVCGMLDEEFRSKVVIKEDSDSDDDLPF